MATIWKISACHSQSSAPLAPRLSPHPRCRPTYRHNIQSFTKWLPFILISIKMGKKDIRQCRSDGYFALRTKTSWLFNIGASSRSLFTLLWYLRYVVNYIHTFLKCASSKIMCYKIHYLNQNQMTK